MQDTSYSAAQRALFEPAKWQRRRRRVVVMSSLSPPGGALIRRQTSVQGANGSKMLLLLSIICLSFANCVKLKQLSSKISSELSEPSKSFNEMIQNETRAGLLRNKRWLLPIPFQNPVQEASSNESLSADIKQHFATTNTNSSSKSQQVNSRRTRKRRRNERKPILNEFSFPTNLVQGMRFVLMCQVLDGDSPIQIKWFKDNREIQALQASGGQQQQQPPPAPSGLQVGVAMIQDPELSEHNFAPAADSNANATPGIELIANEELGASLLFRHVQAKHAGNYTCLATNPFGSSAFSSQMSVKVPPTWRIEPQDRESIMGEQIIIDCQAFGNPNPFIRWKYAGLISTGAELGSSSSNLALGEAVEQQKAAPTTTEQQHQQHQFKLINSNHHVQTLENGSLAIRSVGLEHEGAYLCEADNGVEPNLVKSIRLLVHLQAQFNDADIQLIMTHASSPESGGSTSSSQQVQTTVQQTASSPTISPASSQPSQAQQQQHGTNLLRVGRIVQNTSLVQLQCSPSGDLPVTIDWLKDGQLVYSHTWTSPATSSSTSRSNPSLQTSPEQQQNHPPSTLMNLKHQLELGPRYQVVTRERRLATNQQQQPRTSHPLNNQQINSPAGNVIMLDTELSIATIRRQDAGLYACTARNAYGQSERKLRLLVQESPEAPELIDIVHISSRSIGLRWLAPYDGNSPILKYSLEIRKQHADGGYTQFTNERHKNQPPGSTTLNQSADLHYVTHSEKLMPLKPNQLMMEQLTASSNAGATMSHHQVSSASMLTSAGHASLINGAATQQNIVQHTIHELEPMTRYSLRIVAVNSIGRSRPSVALSVRTDEEVPSIVPTMVEARVLSSRSTKLLWTVAYSPEHELIEGFFLGYRSFDRASSTGSASSQQPLVIQAGSSDETYNNKQTTNTQQQKQPIESPAGKSSFFTYKTIRLSAESQAAAHPNLGSMLRNNSNNPPPTNTHSDILVLTPIASVTKSIAATSSPSAANSYANSHLSQSSSLSGANVVVVQTFELLISGLERDTEYTAMIQCFNQKGAGPTSDPVIFRTFANDPPEKLLLTADDITDSSVKLSWQPLGGQQQQSSSYLSSGRIAPQLSSLLNQPDVATPIDGFVLAFARFIQNNNNNNNNRRNYSSIMNKQQLSDQQGAITDAAARISNDISQQAASAAAASSELGKQHPSIDEWQAIQLPPQQRSHQLRNLDCGSSYGLKIWAINKVGKGEPSDLIKVTTRGKAPVAPDKRSFLSPNITQVKLQLSAWYDGGCEIYKFIVKYRARLIVSTTNNNNNNPRASNEQHSITGSSTSSASSTEWILVSNNIPKDQATLIIRDLQPASHYELLVSAQNQVGSTEVRYRFSTLDLNGQVVSNYATNYEPEADDSMLFDNIDENNNNELANGMNSYDSRRLDQWSQPGGGEHQQRRPTTSSFMALVMQLARGPISFIVSLLLILGLLLTFLFYRFGKDSSQFASCSSSGSSSSTGAGSPNTNNGPPGGGGGGGTTSSSMFVGDEKHCTLKMNGGSIGLLGTCASSRQTLQRNHELSSPNCYYLNNKQTIPMMGHACSLVDSSNESSSCLAASGQATNGLLGADSPSLRATQFGPGSPRQDCNYHQASSLADGFDNQNNNICLQNADNAAAAYQMQQEAAYGHYGSVYASVLGAGGAMDVAQAPPGLEADDQQQQQQQCLMQMLLLAGQNPDNNQADMLQCLGSDNPSITYHGSLARRQQQHQHQLSSSKTLMLNKQHQQLMQATGEPGRYVQPR